jgi:hypothetical protein
MISYSVHSTKHPNRVLIINLVSRLYNRARVGLAPYLEIIIELLKIIYLPILIIKLHLVLLLVVLQVEPVIWWAILDLNQ